MSIRRGSSHSNTLDNQLRSLKSLLNLRLVTGLLELRQETLYQWIKSEGFPHHRIRGRLRFDPLAITALLLERSV